MQSRITFNTKLKIALNVIFKNNAVPIDQLRVKEMTCPQYWSRTSLALLATGRNSSCCSQIARG